MKRVMHWELDAEMTRCGLAIEALETRVTSGSREWVLQTTRDPALVTCKRCRRSIAADAWKK